MDRGGGHVPHMRAAGHARHIPSKRRDWHVPLPWALTGTTLGGDVPRVTRGTLVGDETAALSKIYRPQGAATGDRAALGSGRVRWPICCLLYTSPSPRD